MSVNPADLILVAGGEALERWGTFLRRTVPAYRGGEAWKETVTRADAATCASYLDRDETIRRALANTLRPEWIDGTLYTLHEASRTNLLLQAKVLDNVSWTKTRSSASANADTGPDGAATADRLIEDATATNTHFAVQAVTITANANIALEVYLKPATRTWAWIRVEDSTNTDTIRVFVNLTTGALGTQTTAGTGTIALARAELRDDGFVRCILTGNIGNGRTALNVQYGLATGDTEGTYSGDGVSYIIVGGAQFVQASTHPSSFINTTTTTVTRAGDLVTVPWTNGQEATTVYVRFIERAHPSFVAVGSSTPVIFAIGIAAQPFLTFIKTASYAFEHGASGYDPTATIDLSPSYGDLIELCGQLNADGSVAIHGRKNSGAISSATDTATSALSGSWSDAICSIGATDATNGQADIALRALKIARGVYGLAEIAAA